ncbi:type 2 isopentenyl-diphosphate Delta-isomerase [Baekduia alba]|uniref:type 2 isopentenyl-diphosphate Delta-isomerase n=1 Tax=Baekduia alba TaxID=2997333 RepID=UPI00233FED52|nr:type 2 isopentenyl-diphosphate Delta-isomerase [Baekduia alba]
MQHLEFALADAQTQRPSPWSDIELVHCALPELALDDVHLGVTALGAQLAAPVVIAGMTGGHPRAEELNRRLARAAQRHGVAMGVGSQRAALERPELAATYSVAREAAPDTVLIANLGIGQVLQAGPDAERMLRACVEMIDADAIAVHLNATEEVVQPEGDHDFAGATAALAAAARALHPLPVIAKETGSGLAPGVVDRLVEAGMSALDVGGRGGTSFAAIEGARAAQIGDDVRARLGDLLADWGIPTPVTTATAARGGVPVIAAGGVRTGVDAAKALALGATMVGVGQPVLQAAVEDPHGAERWLEGFLFELRATMFLTGSCDVAALRRAPRVVLGATRQWLDQLEAAEGR